MISLRPLTCLLVCRELKKIVRKISSQSSRFKNKVHTYYANEQKP